jgi:hypothetical protein
MEDVVELRLPIDEVGEALLARLAEILDDAVDELRVPDLVLHLRRQRELALERGSTEDPLALGQDAHELGVAVHLDELDQLLPIVLRHPVGRLDLSAGLDVFEKCLLIPGNLDRCHAAPPSERSLASRL